MHRNATTDRLVKAQRVNRLDANCHNDVGMIEKAQVHRFASLPAKSSQDRQRTIDSERLSPGLTNDERTTAKPIALGSRILLQVAPSYEGSHQSMGGTGAELTPLGDRRNPHLATLEETLQDVECSRNRLRTRRCGICRSCHFCNPSKNVPIVTRFD